MKLAIGWWWTEQCARLLSPADREFVLGDLEEANESGVSAFAAVSGLLLRRHASEFRSWRPWIAAFALAMPASFLLMGFSISIARTYQSLFASTIQQATGLIPAPGFSTFLVNVALLAAWAWTGGFAVGTISRRTTWMSAAASLFACTLCVSRFNIDSLSRFCLLLFLPPAFAGLCLGLRSSRIRFGAALAVAILITALTIPRWTEPAAWMPNWALSWPAWYLVVVAARARRLHNAN
jgi:hypothetical protein